MTKKEFPCIYVSEERCALSKVCVLSNSTGSAEACPHIMVSRGAEIKITDMKEFSKLAGGHCCVESGVFSFVKMPDEKWNEMFDGIRRNYLAKPRTYLMRWNPSISSLTKEKYENELVNYGWETELNWSIWEYDDAMPGDRFFMLREGDGEAPGIYFEGLFRSLPWEGDDWRGTDKKRFYIDMTAGGISPLANGPVVATDELERKIPGVNWRIGHSGELLSQEVADKLKALWDKNYVEVSDEEDDDDDDDDEIMTPNSMLEDAVCLAHNAHSGQVDKAGKSYILHPLRVAHNCETIEQKTVALLHDVLEDSDYTPDNLLNGWNFPQEIVDAVVALTRQEGESYDEFIERCKANPLARYVKLRDLRDNLDVTRLEELDEEACKRVKKYLKAIRLLEAE